MITIEDLNKAKIEIESTLAAGRVPETEQVDKYRLALQDLAHILPVLVRHECTATLRSACRAVSGQYRTAYRVDAVQRGRLR